MSVAVPTYCALNGLFDDVWDFIHNELGLHYNKICQSDWFLERVESIKTTKWQLLCWTQSISSQIYFWASIQERSCIMTNEEWNYLFSTLVSHILWNFLCDRLNKQWVSSGTNWIFRKFHVILFWFFQPPTSIALYNLSVLWRTFKFKAQAAAAA